MYPSYIKQILFCIWVGFLCVPLLFFPLLRGIDAPFTDVSDNDSVYISQALQVNSPKYSQTYFDHTGQLYTYFLAGFFHLGKWFDYVPVSNLDQLKESQTPIKDFAQLNTFSRGTSAFLSTFFIIAFSFGIYHLYQSFSLAVLAGALLAISHGTIIHSLILRSELLSAMLQMIGVFALLTAFRSHWKFKVFLSGFALYASFMAKIQGILPAMTFPGIIYAFSYRSQIRRQLGPLFGSSSKMPLLIFILLVFGVVSWTLILREFLFRSLYGYQVFVIIYLLGTVIVYTVIYHLNFKSMVLFILLMLNGMGLAFMITYIEYHPENTLAIFEFASWSSAALQGGGQTGYEGLLNKMSPILSTLGFSSYVGPRAIHETPIRLLSLFSILALMMMGMCRKYKACFQLSILIGIPYLLEALFRIRYYASFYAVYVEWIVIFGFIHSCFLIVREFSNIRVSLLSTILVISFLYIGLSFQDGVMRTHTRSFKYITLKQNITYYCFMSMTYSIPLFQTINDSIPIQGAPRRTLCEIATTQGFNQLSFRSK